MTAPLCLAFMVYGKDVCMVSCSPICVSVDPSDMLTMHIALFYC